MTPVPGYPLTCGTCGNPIYADTDPLSEQVVEKLRPLAPEIDVEVIHPLCVLCFVGWIHFYLGVEVPDVA
jgi:hypothetical protein